MRKDANKIVDELVPDEEVKIAQSIYQPGDKVLVKDVTGATFKVTLVRMSEGNGERGWVMEPDPDAFEVSPKEDAEGNPWIAEADIMSKVASQVKTASFNEVERLHRKIKSNVDWFDRRLPDLKANLADENVKMLERALNSVLHAQEMNLLSAM